MPPEVTIIACALSAKSPTTVRELAAPALHRARLQHLAEHPVDHAAARGSARSRDGGSAATTSPRFGALAHARHERLDDAGPGAPGDVEARHRVAVLGGEVAAALGPADDGEPAQAPARAARRASRPPRRRRRPRPSAAASGPPRGRSRPSPASPAAPGRSCRGCRRRRCSGESTRKSPPNDQNACPPSDCSGS